MLGISDAPRFCPRCHEPMHVHSYNDVRMRSYFVAVRCVCGTTTGEVMYETIEDTGLSVSDVAYTLHMDAARYTMDAPTAAAEKAVVLSPVPPTGFTRERKIRINR